MRKEKVGVATRTSECGMWDVELIPEGLSGIED